MHPAQIVKWKKQMMKGVLELFNNKNYNKVYTSDRLLQPQLLLN